MASESETIKRVSEDEQIMAAVRRRIEKGTNLPFHCANGHESVQLAELGMESSAVLTCPRCRIKYYCSAVAAKTPGEPAVAIQVTVGSDRR